NPSKDGLHQSQRPWFARQMIRCEIKQRFSTLANLTVRTRETARFRKLIFRAGITAACESRSHRAGVGGGQHRIHPFFAKGDRVLVSANVSRARWAIPYDHLAKRACQISDCVRTRLPEALVRGRQKDAGHIDHGWSMPFVLEPLCDSNPIFIVK